MDPTQQFIVGVQLTPETLREIMENLSEEKAQSYAPMMLSAMEEFEIISPLRAAAFAAELGHESNGLTEFEEEDSGRAYEGRVDLGNTSPGDGVKYKGRGPIEVTGKSNYEKYGKRLGLDLVSHPEMAAEPIVGFRIAGMYWFDHGLNALADKNDIQHFRGITYRINGGFNGEDSRERYWARARRAYKID